MYRLKLFLFGVLVLTISFTSLVTPVRAEDPFPNCRLGVGGIENGVTGYNLGQLNMGLYLDWGSRDALPPGLPAGMQYFQVVRVHQNKVGSEWHGGGAYVQPPAYTALPGQNTLAQRAASLPGSVWFIGNEIERRDWYDGSNWRGQDEITPEVYATAFHELQAIIKAADPTAKVGIGSLVEPTALRLKYLDRVWNSYYEQYGYPMGKDIDVWNIHGFILREVRNAWGADTPAGLTDTSGFLAGKSTAQVIAAHHDINHLKQFTQDLRAWMAAHGERNKPLINTEYGILYKNVSGNQITPAQVNAFLEASFDYFFTATDPDTGYPADDNRLVQSWVWYSVQDTSWNGNLFNASNKSLTTFGTTWKNYVSNPGKPLASQPQRNLLVTNLQIIPPNPVTILPGKTATVTLKADIANSGNTWTNTNNNIVVKFWDGPPGGAGSNVLGSRILNDLPGCGQLVHVEIEWPNLLPGEYNWYAQVVPIANETRTNDNVASGRVEVVEEGIVDLAVTQVDTPDPVLVGNNLSYAINLTNNGPHLAKGVTLIQTLSGNATINQVTPSQGSCIKANPITCNFGNLPSGNSITINTQVTPTGGGTLTSIAQVANQIYDPNILNNSSVQSSTVTAPVLEFSKASYTVNEGVGAVITVTRAGLSGLPVTVNYATSDGTATAGADYTPKSGTLTWPANDLSSRTIVVNTSNEGVVEDNETVKLTLSNPGGGASLGTIQFATLTIEDGGTGTPPEANLAVILNDAPDPVLSGNKLTYTIQVTNKGPDQATGITLFDNLPLDVALASISAPQGILCTGTSLIACNINNLAKDATVAITINVTPTKTGPIENTVNVTGNQVDPEPGNNVASTTTTVTAQGSIKVHNYHDRNGNGQKDGNEPGLNGWSIVLYDAQNKVVASNITQPLSGENGWVRFTNLPPGTYKVCELLVEQGGWANSDPGGANSCKAVTLAGNPTEKTALLGNYQYSSLRVIKESNIIYTFAFTQGVETFTLTSNSLENSRKFNNLAPGNYVVSENPASMPSQAWFLDRVICLAANGQPAPITVDLPRLRATIPISSGQNLTCTFYNAQPFQENPNFIYLPLILTK